MPRWLDGRPLVTVAGAILATLAGAATVSGAAGRDASGNLTSSADSRAAPIRFTGDACKTFAPVGRWNGRIVFLDPGHGGLDPGAITRGSGRRVEEERVTLAVGLRTLELLRKSGFRVVMSRLRDSTVAQLGSADRDGQVLTASGLHRDLAARNLCANRAHASASVGIHMNAFGDASVAGAETIFCRDRRFAGRSRQLAADVLQMVLTRLRRSGWRVPDRGIHDDHRTGTPALTAEGAAYGHWLELGPGRPPWFRSPSQMPAAVIEPLFISNPVEATIAVSRRGQVAIAEGLARGIAAYFHPRPAA